MTICITLPSSHDFIYTYSFCIYGFRYTECNPTSRAYLKYAKWEEKQFQFGLARGMSIDIIDFLIAYWFLYLLKFCILCINAGMFFRLSCTSMLLFVVSHVELFVNFHLFHSIFSFHLNSLSFHCILIFVLGVYERALVEIHLDEKSEQLLIAFARCVN